MEKQTVLSQMALNPFLAVITHMAGETIRWPGVEDSDFFDRASFQFTITCDKRRHYLEREAARYWWLNSRELIQQTIGVDVPPHEITRLLKKGHRLQGELLPQQQFELLVNGISSLTDDQRKGILREFTNKVTAPKHLFHPLCSMALGHTDNLTIFLADEFHQAADAFENPDLPVRQTCTALCPDIRAMGIQIGEGTPFCDIKDIFDSYNQTQESLTYSFREEHTEKRVVIPYFSMLENRPLIAVTYYRISGLCNLGSGLLFQEALIRASLTMDSASSDSTSTETAPEIMEQMVSVTVW